MMFVIQNVIYYWIELTYMVYLVKKVGAFRSNVSDCKTVTVIKLLNPN
jgi:hypothetical protein